MNTKDFNKYVDSRVPLYHSEHEGLFDDLCEKQSQNSSRNRFGPLYQLYMYAFFIGYYTNSRISPPDKNMKKFLEFGNWRHNNSEITGLMLMILMNEIIDDFHKFESGTDEDVKARVNEMFTAMDEYVHGGLNHIKKCIDESLIELDDIYKFHRILVKVAKADV